MVRARSSHQELSKGTGTDTHPRFREVQLSLTERIGLRPQVNHHYQENMARRASEYIRMLSSGVDTVMMMNQYTKRRSAVAVRS